MHIGVDLDNTILDATSAHLQYYNTASGLSFTPEDVNDIHWNSSPFPMAVEILQQLFNKHKISIITAR